MTKELQQIADEAVRDAGEWKLKCREQAREIEQRERDAKNDAIAYKAAIERQNELRAELAALKARPSGVVLPPHCTDRTMPVKYRKGWNCCISEVARLNQPASAGDERAAFEDWAHRNWPGAERKQLERDEYGDYKNSIYRDFWTGWQARAALSANHSEQVRVVANQCAETCERAKLCATCAGELEFPGLPAPGSIAEARIPHHTSDGRQMLWAEVEVIAHKIIQGAVYSWVKELGNDGGFYAPMMLSFRAAPSSGSQGGDV